LLAVARRIVRSEDLAQDTVQEALLSFWLEAEVPPNPRAWLIRTVVHRSLHLSRTSARRRKHEGRACRCRPEASDRDDPARTMERDDFVGVVYGALGQIAPEHRAVLVMKNVQEMNYQAIADALHIPVGTVRSRLNRARKSVRAILRQLEPDEDHSPSDPHAGMG